MAMDSILLAATPTVSTKQRDHVDSDGVGIANSLLEGFMMTDEPRQVQENVYVILGHGKYQRHVLLCGTLSMFVLFLNALAHKLVNLPVDHWCSPPEELRYLGAAEWRNNAIPIQPDGSFSRCTVYDPPMPAWDYDTSWPEDSIVSRWDLVCERAWMFQLSPLTYMLGAVLFAPVAGLLADRVGRRPIIFVAVAALLLSSLGACAAKSFFYFLLTRLTVSGSAHSIVLLLYILLYEVTGSERRSVFGLIDTGLPFTVVPRMLEALSWLHPHWFLVQAFILIPTGLLALCCYLLEESPIWLLATWRTHEAEHLMLAAAGHNGVDHRLAKNSYRVLLEQLAKVEEKAPSSGFDARLRAASAHTQVVTVALSWFTLTLTLYASALRPAKPSNGILELVHICMQSLCYALTCLYMHLRGHRSALSVGLVLLGVFLILQAAFTYNAQEQAARLSTMIVQCVCFCAHSINYGFTAEVYPTAMRSIGMAVSFDIGRLGGLMAAALALTDGADALLAIELAMALLVVLTAVAIQLLPEVFVMHKPKRKLPEVLTPQERKEVIKASLSPHRHRYASSGPSSPQRSLLELPYSSLAPSFIRRSSAYLFPIRTK